MRRSRSLWWIVGGLILLLAAACLAGYNFLQDKNGEKTAQSALSEIQAQVSTSADAKPKPQQMQENDLYAEYATDMPQEEMLIEIDGYTYLGYLSIPSLDLELPVLSEWSYPNLGVAPCRYGGTVADGNLMIAAHNYRSHFGRIGELVSGDAIYFTDGSGTVHEYEVIQSELIAGHDVPAMEANAESWDLTLFTCTWSGRNRVTVRAVEVQKDNHTLTVPQETITP